MKDIYLVSYSVSGIKTIDRLVTLSFYKKIISPEPDTSDYNVKGIYGINGSGKSGIIASVDILKSLLTNPEYLNNPVVQKKLDAMINKKTEKLFIRAEFISGFGKGPWLFRYEITLQRAASRKYVISGEEFSFRKATSKNSSMETLFKVCDGEIVDLKGKQDNFPGDGVYKKTMNRLSASTLCALCYDGQLMRLFLYYVMLSRNNTVSVFEGLILLMIFGEKLCVYLDAADEHKEYLIRNLADYLNELKEEAICDFGQLFNFAKMYKNQIGMITVSENRIPRIVYRDFELTVGKLCEFLKIFKSDLRRIEIDKKEDQDIYICSLIMVYDSYKIHAEFESTGVKKLIRLFAYLRKMVQGGIVFIDEFDSNLHDVYLCALLEYLMEYGEGQLCFTTHNVGPMDILRHHKKSIDFLSEDHQIYPWTTNGNYSPSKLYRNGMIEGSPFNVDSIDFISAFGPEKGDA